MLHETSETHKSQESQEAPSALDMTKVARKERPVTEGNSHQVLRLRGGGDERPLTLSGYQDALGDKTEEQINEESASLVLEWEQYYRDETALTGKWEQYEQDKREAYSNPDQAAQRSARLELRSTLIQLNKENKELKEQKESLEKQEKKLEERKKGHEDIKNRQPQNRDQSE